MQAAFDAVVAGAGPAGATAARLLALSGWSVLIAGSPARRTLAVGETLSGEGSRLLKRLGLPTPEKNQAHTRVNGLLAAWTGDGFVRRDYLLEINGASWRLNRAVFDASLRRSAREVGAESLESDVVRVERFGATWRIGFASGARAEARWIVDATGRRAFVGRRCGAHRRRNTRLVAIYALAPAASPSTPEATMIEAVPEGWWYGALLPSGAVVAGLHTDPRSAAALAGRPAAWRAAFERTRRLAPAMGSPVFGTPLAALDASNGVLDPVHGDGWVACGDAALTLDPLAGHGIASAVESGARAAHAVDRALVASSDEALADYAASLARAHAQSLDTLSRLYRAQNQWPDAPFWSDSTRLAISSSY